MRADKVRPPPEGRGSRSEGLRWPACRSPRRRFSPPGSRCWPPHRQSGARGQTGKYRQRSPGTQGGENGFLPMTLRRARSSPSRMKYMLSPGSPCFTMTDHCGTFSTSTNCAKCSSCSSVMPPRILIRRRARGSSPRGVASAATPAVARPCSIGKTSATRAPHWPSAGAVLRGVNPCVSGHTLILDPGDQRGQFHGAVGGLVNAPDNKT